MYKKQKKHKKSRIFAQNTTKRVNVFNIQLKFNTNRKRIALKKNRQKRIEKHTAEKNTIRRYTNASKTTRLKRTQTRKIHTIKRVTLINKL